MLLAVNSSVTITLCIKYVIFKQTHTQNKFKFSSLNKNTVTGLMYNPNPVFLLKLTPRYLPIQCSWCVYR